MINPFQYFANFFKKQDKEFKLEDYILYLGKVTEQVWTNHYTDANISVFIKNENTTVKIRAIDNEWVNGKNTVGDLCGLSVGDIICFRGYWTTSTSKKKKKEIITHFFVVTEYLIEKTVERPKEKKLFWFKCAKKLWTPENIEKLKIKLPEVYKMNEKKFKKLYLQMKKILKKYLYNNYMSNSLQTQINNLRLATQLGWHSTVISLKAEIQDAMELLSLEEKIQVITELDTIPNLDIPVREKPTMEAPISCVLDEQGVCEGCST